MAKDVLEVERPLPERPDPSAPKPPPRILNRLKTPVWQTRETGQPMLVDPARLKTDYLIDFHASVPTDMNTFAFEVRAGGVAPFIAGALPASGKPKAWVLYFRHTAQKKDFTNNLLELGGGDYLLGRMQACNQITASKKSVGVIIPIGFGDIRGFAQDQALITQCIREIEASLLGGVANLPLLGACNSDSIFLLDGFLKKCPLLRARTKAVYDFDGSHRIGSEGITLIVKGAQTFRYMGPRSPQNNTGPETDENFLARTMGGQPAVVPLALSRWRKHRDFKIVRPTDAPPIERKKGEVGLEARDVNDFNWLHHRIPCCMLHHGLASTTGI
jgi:hypothetical protein